MIEMKELLTRKQWFVLRELGKCVKRLARFMYAEGISHYDVNTFFMQSVFQTCSSVTERKKKLSLEFSSQTEEQTNSQTSDRLRDNLQITIDKAITTRLQSGQTLHKILLSYAERCSLEEQKFRNYLLSQEEIPIRSVQFRKSIDFQSIRDRIHKKYISRMDQSPIRYSNVGSSEDVYSLGSSYEAVTPRRRRVDDQTENQINYMQSFQRSLAQSIKKTRLLRNMLEKQLSFQPSRSSFNHNEEQHSRQEEIY